MDRRVYLAGKVVVAPSPDHRADHAALVGDTEVDVGENRSWARWCPIPAHGGAFAARRSTDAPIPLVDRRVVIDGGLRRPAGWVDAIVFPFRSDFVLTTPHSGGDTEVDVGVQV